MRKKILKEPFFNVITPATFTSTEECDSKQQPNEQRNGRMSTGSCYAIL